MSELGCGKFVKEELKWDGDEGHICGIYYEALKKVFLCSSCEKLFDSQHTKPTRSGTVSSGFDQTYPRMEDGSEKDKTADKTEQEKQKRVTETPVSASKYVSDFEKEKGGVKMTDEMKDNTQVIISRKEKPNTYEVGRAGHRHTIAYETPEELDAMIKSLKALGYFDEEEK